MPLESKIVPFTPIYCSIWNTSVYIASRDYLVFWQFQNNSSSRFIALNGTCNQKLIIAVRRKNITERGFHIDDIYVIGTTDADFNTDFTQLRLIIFSNLKRPSKDPICCIAGNDNTILAARESGLLMQFSMPSMTLEEKYTIPPKNHTIDINCDGSRAVLIDGHNVLRLIQLEKRTSSMGADQSGGVELHKITTVRLIIFEKTDQPRSVFPL